MGQSKFGNLSNPGNTQECLPKVFLCFQRFPHHFTYIIDTLFLLTLFELFLKCQTGRLKGEGPDMSDQ